MNEYLKHIAYLKEELNKAGYHMEERNAPALHYHIEANEGNDSTLVGNYYHHTRHQAIEKFMIDILGKDIKVW